jgi:hypothetical protein
VGFEPGVGVVQKARELGWIAATGRRDDFEHGASLLEVWPMDEPARAPRRGYQMGQRLEHESHPFRVATSKASQPQLSRQVQRFAIGHPAHPKVGEQAGHHERVRRLHPGRDPAAHRGQVVPGRALEHRTFAGAQQFSKRREQEVKQRQLVHQLERTRGGGDAQRAENLLDHPRHRGIEQVLAMALDGGARVRLDFEAELGREAHRAQHPDRILAHPNLGIADGADAPRLEVGNSAGVVDHMKGARAVE